MPKLSSEKVLDYETTGYVAPLAVLSAEEVKHYRQRYEEYEQWLGDRASAVPPRDRLIFYAETHTSLRWIYELATHPNVLDAVESILGPDLLIWDSRWFPKPPRDKTYIGWHQDGTYWRLEPPKVCTAWIALTDSIAANGAMRVIPTSHQAQLPHRDTYAPDSALTRGQEIAVEVDESEAVTICLMPGEMSIHHIGIVHGSKPNLSDQWRIGLAVRFIAPEVHQQAESPLAMLVRGRDRYGNFELIPPPDDGSQEELEARREKILDRFLHGVVDRDT